MSEIKRMAGFNEGREECAVVGRLVRSCSEIWLGSSVGSVGRGRGQLTQRLAKPSQARPNRAKRALH